MKYFVYLIINISKDKSISYVGYTNNLDKRLFLHNSSKGAKFTRGRKWTLIYKKEYKSKSQALIEEYKLKKNYKLRSIIKLNYIKKK
jgi:putative endonuclease